MEAVAHDDVVVDGHDGGEGAHGEADAARYGRESPHGEGAELRELAEGDLHVVHGLADEQEEDEVGQEEGPAAVLVGQVGEPPHVADADGEADAGEDELPLRAPVVALRALTLPGKAGLVELGAGWAVA